MKRAPLLFAVLILLSSFAGCVRPDAQNTPAAIGGTGAAPPPLTDASRWKSFVVADEIPVPAPMGGDARARAAAFAATPEGKMLARATLPRVATQEWTELQLDMVATFKPSPPRVARGLALVHIAMYDALIVAQLAQARHARDGEALPHPSAEAAIAGAAALVLAELFPDQGSDWFGGRAEDAAFARVAHGLASPDGAQAGLDLGAEVARRVLARVAEDGSGSTLMRTPPQGPCHWRPTPPSFIEFPLEPEWGNVTTWFLPSGSALRPAPPPDCLGQKGRDAFLETYHVSSELSDRQDAIGYYWSTGPDSVSAPALWNRIAIDMASRADLDTAEAARLFVYLNSALHDAGVGVWDAKYTYWSIRPVTYIREHLDPDLRTLVATPPFPAYPSAHAGFSGAAAGVLSDFLPEQALSIRALATEAAISRLYVGSQTRASTEEGLVLGEAVAALALRQAHADGGWRGAIERPEAKALYEEPATGRWALRS